MIILLYILNVICPLCLPIVEETYQFICSCQYIYQNCKRQVLPLQLMLYTRHQIVQSKHAMLTVKYFDHNTLNKVVFWGVWSRRELRKLKKDTYLNIVVLNWIVQMGVVWRFKVSTWQNIRKNVQNVLLFAIVVITSQSEVVINEHHLFCDTYLIICPNKCSDNDIEWGVLPSNDYCPNQLF